MDLDNLGKALNESSAAKGKKKPPKGGKDPLSGLVDSLNSSQSGSANLGALLASNDEMPAAAQQQAPAWQDSMANQAPAQGGGLGSLLGGLEDTGSSQGAGGGLGSLLGMLGGGAPSGGSQSAAGGLGSLLGGLGDTGSSQSSSSDMGGFGSLLGMLGGGSPSAGSSSSAGMGGLGSLLGMLGGGSGAQTAPSAMGFLGNTTASSPFDALAAPLAKKLGIPTQLASLLIMFVANSLLNKKSDRSGQFDVNRAADVSQVLDLAERGQINENALHGNQLVRELSQETGLDEETSARGIHELMLMLNQGTVE
ncbi:MAG: hypothetical protein ABTQ73_12980 [Caldilineales bacterium]